VPRIRGKPKAIGQQVCFVSCVCGGVGASRCLRRAILFVVVFLCNICRAGTQTATSNPEILAIGSSARYLGTQAATSNPGIQVIGSWARYLGLGTQA
jgi:hypothetical protein